VNLDNNFPDESVHAPTVQLVNCAYPMGIPHAHYMTLLSILIKDMSIRVLAAVIAHIRGGHYSVYVGEVATAKQYIPDEQVASTVKQKLINCGYESWLSS
jgi:hypothetical protein